MKILRDTCRNFLISVTALTVTACGGISSSVEPISTPISSMSATQQKKMIDEDVPQTKPLHDISWEEYQKAKAVHAELGIAIDSGDSSPTISATSTPTPTPTPTSSPSPTPSEKPVVTEPVVPPVVPSKPKQPISSETPKNQMKILEVGVIKPTVYYFPVYNEDKDKCESKEMQVLHGVNGEKILNVCPNTLAGCSLQGSCAVIQKGQRHSFNISDRIRGQDRFFEMTDGDCRFGYGVRSVCLDPFFSVAADLDMYNVGDVIYVPAVAGLNLPNGGVHDGFFIVRDQGRGINGKGRFDFYSGFLGWNDSKNPFRQLGLSDIKTQVPYYKIGGEKAQLVLKRRSYPALPARKQ